MESENQVKFYFGIIAVMLAFVIITGGFILAVIRYQKRLYFKQQELLRLDAQHKKELLLSSIKSAETERMQLAKDIHDEIGSIFSTLSLSVNQLTSDNTHHLEASKSLIQSGIDSVRRISHAIVPFELELLGLEQTLENYFERLGLLSGITIDFENTAPLEKLNITATLALYRIVQELCSNCIKHARAKNIHLHITEHENEIALNYRDDGVGATLNDDGIATGIGLKNIESRVIVMNGKINFTSQPGQGFACRVIIPLLNNSIV